MGGPAKAGGRTRKGWRADPQRLAGGPAKAACHISMPAWCAGVVCGERGSAALIGRP